ncbi:hypothetical protein K5V21_12610 [Clostridium sardiniense]|uniref:Uncharacterized protein n=1 Tax=Clostridium sardiniense TaxID=29369 RepID=A0ABS7KZU0_CLOSR|nr:hypothetical protein [Clostridium sardiniense]MBY0756289.1 hypothetical protein [Clostridium sardiniense]MDQ0458496.1 hypothetical protein [Clostridium sardiniense]
MSEIKIRNVPKHIISKIDEDWKKQNYKSRNEYLNKQLELMISLEPLKNMEDNYSYLINRLGKIIEHNSALMELLAKEILSENINEILNNKEE